MTLPYALGHFEYVNNASEPKAFSYIDCQVQLAKCIRYIKVLLYIGTSI